MNRLEPAKSWIYLSLLQNNTLKVRWIRYYTLTKTTKKAFGKTVSELDISDAAICVEKTKFSMYLPKVVDLLKEKNINSIILLGIEVRETYMLYRA